jgi:hypothetical protein
MKQLMIYTILVLLTSITASANDKTKAGLQMSSALNKQEFSGIYSEADFFSKIESGQLKNLTKGQVENWFYGMLPTVYFENGEEYVADPDAQAKRVVTDVATLTLPSVQTVDLSSAEIMTVHLKSIAELAAAGSGLLAKLVGLKCIRVVVEIPDCFQNSECQNELTDRLTSFFPTTKIGNAYIVYAFALAD